MGLWVRIKKFLFYIQPDVRPLHLIGRTALYLFLLLWGWQLISMDYDVLVGGYPEIGDSFMHHVNLIFHEAGHVIFLPFGRFMTILGGTLNQWLIPFIVLTAFVLKTRDTFGASVGLWWLGESFMDAAPYINDARSGRLMLLGGVTGQDRPGYHDWENILRELGWMEYDHTIAGMVDGLGVTLMLLSFLWGATVLYLQYLNLPKKK